MVRHGALVNESDNIERWKAGQGGTFRALAFRGVEGSNDARHASAFHPIAEDFAKKAQRIGKFEGSDDDMRWWVGMVSSWAISLREPDFILAQYPIMWCRLIDEFPFQQRVLARFVEARFGGRPVPLFSLPDFIPHDGA